MIFKNDELDVFIYGSLACGLDLAESDIDI